MPDWSVFPKGKHISVSQAKLCHQCMFAWKCRYIDKIVKPKSQIMQLGIEFDELCNGEPIKANPLVLARYELYKSHIHPDDPRQIPVWMPIEGTDYHVIGWVDRIEVATDIAVDHKLAEKPWADWKLDTYKIQAQTYLACLQNMGKPIDKFRFDVVNLITPEIQEFPYKPQKKTLAKVHNYYRQAIEWIKTGWHEPEFNDLCNWCDYQIECEKYLSKGLKTDETTN